MGYEDVGREIVDSAIKVHRGLGPGLFENVYETCLARELTNRGFEVLVQMPMPIYYEGELLEKAYRLDMLVNGSVVVEVKAVDTLTPLHRAQMLTYLKLGNHKLGFLLNFNSRQMRDGIKRFVNHL
jgi:GxxExxY protein